MSDFERTVRAGAEEVARRVAAAGPTYATAEDTVAQSAEWTDKQLMCRTKGHRFTVSINAQYYSRYRYYYVELGCEGGCGVVQVQEMNVRGHVYFSTLRYPPGYLSKSGRVVGDAKDALRIELIERVFHPTTSRTTKVEPHSGYDEAVQPEDGKAAAS